MYTFPSYVPSRVTRFWSKPSTWSYLQVFIWAVLWCLATWQIAEIPRGFFCDEAAIGLEGWRWAHGDFGGVSQLFFYHHLEYFLGFLGPLSVAPFVGVFGLSEWVVRVASVCYMLLGIGVCMRILHKLRVGNGWIAAIVIFTTPIVFHTMRTQFGLTVSLLCLLLSLYFYITSLIHVRVNPAAKDPESQDRCRFGMTVRSLILVAFFAALAGYGNIAFTIGGAIWIMCICLSILLSGGGLTRKVRSMALLLIVYAICMSPFVYASWTDPQFLKRLEDKNRDSQMSLLSTEKALFVVQQYPRYFSTDYLFLKGEIDSPGTGNLRHSIRGVGEYYPLYLPLLLMGVYRAFGWKKEKKYRQIHIALSSFFFLYPLVDAWTQDGVRPPYTYTMFMGVMPYGIYMAMGIDAVVELYKRSLSTAKVIVCVIGVVLLLSWVRDVWRFSLNYLDSPVYSSDFYGWQWGPREIISYFIVHQSQYDEMIMEGAFNGGEIFIPFYDHTNRCRGKCILGGVEEYDSDKRQLFAIQPSSYPLFAQKDPHLKKVHAIYYPDGREAFGFYATER